MEKQTAPLTINTTHLTRRFGEVTAVDNLTLQVPAGCIFGFLGPNGAGKTTTIRLLLGLLEPDDGRAEILGCDTQTQATAIRNQTGVLLEHNGLYERLSVADNLEFFARIWRIPTAERQTRIKDLLGHFDLWNRRRDFAGTLSRGMKQKLAIARALLHRPALVFLDEPTAGLDPAAAIDLREHLLALSKQEKVTVFLTTHNLLEAEQLCNQVGVIRDGKLIANGTPKELLDARRTPRVEILGAGFEESLIATLQQRPEVAAVALQNGKLALTLQEGADLTPLLTLLAQAGARIEEVHKDGGNLEELFLTLMQEAV